MKRRHFIAALYIPLAAGPSAALAAPANDASSARFRILIVGDSLSAEYGLRRGAGWVSLLEQRLGKEDVSAHVRNASISGDTTSGGRARLGALLKSYRPTHVVLELGGNDALRGLPLQSTADNLREMTRAAQEAGAKVLVVGMQVPPNYGGDYGRQFAQLFVQVASERKAALVPFLLKGVADRPDAATLFQADRIHPREEAQAAMLDNVWPELRKQLR